MVTNLQTATKTSGTTNVTSESILISILYLIGGFIPWPKSNRKRGRGRPDVSPLNGNTEMFCSQDMAEIGF